MRRSSRATATLAAVLALSLTGSGLALADDITNNLDGTVDAVAETMALTAGGASRSTTLSVVQRGEDGKPGCNLTGQTQLKISLANSDPSVATLSTSALTFGTCGESFPVTVTPTSKAGTAKITATVTSNNTGGSFDLAPAAFDVVVTSATPVKSNQTITFVQPTTPATYGDSFSVQPTASSNLPVTVVASGGCSAAAVGTAGAYSITMTSGTTACSLTASQAGSSTYNAAADVVRTVAAAPRAITVAANSAGKTYGDADPVLTTSLTSGSLIGTDTLSGSVARVAGEGIGTYAINRGSLAAGSNYDMTFVVGALEIAQRAITVTADPKSKTYGDADPALTYSITEGTLASGDSLTGALNRATGQDAGTYAISQGTVAANGNYALNFVGSDLTITQRAIAVAAADQTKVYGDDDPALTYSVTAGSLASGDAFTGSLARVAGGDVGSYAITQGTLSAGGNYDLTVAPGELSITQRAITVTADDKGKTYGTADPKLTASVSSGNLVGTDALSGSLSRVAGEAVGTYAIDQGTLAASVNYALTFVSGTLEIAARSVTVTADPKSKTYGDADPVLTYDVTSGTLAAGDSFTGSLDRAGGEDVAGYAITQGTLDLGGNYALSFVGAELTINQRAITVTAGAQTKVYGDDDPALTYGVTSGSLKSGDAFNGSLTRTAGDGVGSFAITQGTLTAGGNYALTYAGANLSITPKPITVTADDKSKIYGDDDPALTTSVTSGSLVGTDALSGGLARAAGENVGSYAIGQGTLSAGANYSLTFVAGSFGISVRSITVTADAKTKTYGEADPSLTYQVTNLVGSDQLTGALARSAGNDVGRYDIGLGTVAAGDNYVVTFVPNQLVITQRSITVTAAPKTKTYGDADPALTYSLTGSLAYSDAFEGGLVRTDGENVGTFDIQLGSLSAGTNYALTFVGADLTITARALGVTAADASKTYGDDDPGLGYALTSGTLVGQDGFSGALTRAAGADVGSYAITQGTLSAGANYALTVVPATLTIRQRAITVTADKKGKTFGDADPELTASVTEGNLVGTDALSGSPVRAAGEAVGSYPINQGTVSAGGNYALTFVAGSFEIATRAVTVKADATSKTYGDADPALTYTITSGSLAAGDSFTGSLVRADGEDAGGYAISQGTLDLSTNYALSFVGAELTINKRAIAVTADALTKVYGENDPDLSYKVTGGSLVAGDGFTGSLVRAAGNGVGTYAITQNTLSAGGNYALTYVGANLTVTAKPITVTADPKTKTFGAADPALTYAITTGGLLPGDAMTGSLTRAAGETVGSYAINQGSVTAGSNYAITYVGSKLTITSWTYVGFKSPVGMDRSKVNSLKGGSTVPLKFNVFAGGVEQTGAGTVVGTVTVTAPCDSGSTTDAVSTSTAGLRYDVAGGQWVFQWKAPTALGCYRVGVTLADGSRIVTNFQVTK